MTSSFDDYLVYRYFVNKLSSYEDSFVLVQERFKKQQEFELSKSRGSPLSPLMESSSQKTQRVGLTVWKVVEELKDPSPLKSSEL